MGRQSPSSSWSCSSVFSFVCSFLQTFSLSVSAFQRWPKRTKNQSNIAEGGSVVIVDWLPLWVPRRMAVLALTRPAALLRPSVRRNCAHSPQYSTCWSCSTRYVDDSGLPNITSQPRRSPVLRTEQSVLCARAGLVARGREIGSVG